MPIYMNYDGVPGDVTAAGHEKWIECNSFQWGVGRGVSSPVGGSADREASAPSISEIVVTKALDASSNAALKEALWGEGKPVTIHFLKTDKDKLVVYLEIKLENAMISGFSMSSGGDRPSESLSINFTKIEYCNTPNDAKTKASGPARVMYDLATAKGS